MKPWRSASGGAGWGHGRRSMEVMEPRVLLAGLTFVTHGQSMDRSLEPWVMSMAMSIAERIEPTIGGVSVMTLSLLQSGGSISPRFEYAPGSPRLSEVPSGEGVVVLDWSQFADGFFIASHSTKQVARWFRDALVSPWLVPDLGAPLVSLPMHFLGHSRGGSLVCELAALLGKQGIWVDQVTTMDPHPRDFLSGDAPLRITSNVVFADNYWQPTTTFTYGNPIPNQAFNVKLPALSGGYNNAHSNVHLWYAGTISPYGTVYDGQATLSDERRSTWYVPSEEQGSKTGFAFARSVGHERDYGHAPIERSTYEFAIRGLHTALGGLGSRTVVDGNEIWGNLLDLGIAESASPRYTGRLLDVNYTTGNTSPIRVEITVDVDGNPLNGNGLYTVEMEHGESLGAIGHHQRAISTSDLSPGRYYLTAKVIHLETMEVRYASSLPFTLESPPPLHGVADEAGGFTVTGFDSVGQAAAFQEREGRWRAAYLQSATGSPPVHGEVVTWIDPNDGLNYAAAPSAHGLIVYAQARSGEWTYRNLSWALSGATPPSDKLAVLVSRSDVVMLAGIDIYGQFVLYVRDHDLPGGWVFRNISGTDLSSTGQPTPFFASSLAAFVTPWDAWNVVGLDSFGQIQAIWIHPGSMERWSVANLSVSTGAPPLAGELTVYQTEWNAINLVGTDEFGRVSATWWLPEFGSQWRTSNLTDIIGGPRLKPSSVASFVTSWGAMNIAGIAGDGSVVVYWWTPESDRWQIAPLSETISSADRMVGRVTGLTTTRYQINLAGQSERGDVIRYYWSPGDSWRFENISAAVG